MSAAKQLCFTNAQLVMRGEDGPVRGGLRVEGGVIAEVGPDVAPKPGDEAIDSAGALLAPGLIDLGVFAIDVAVCHAGGILRIGLMPDEDPPLDHPANVRFAALAAKPGLWVHPFAAATAGLGGERLAELGLMKAAGARMVATGRHWITNSGLMLRLLEQAAALDLVVVSHAEDAGLVGSAVATAGEMATRLGLPSAPAEAEALAIARDIRLVELAGAAIHFRQVTTRAGLDLVRQAKARGARVTCGVTPAHFLLNDLELAGFRSFAKLSPPLRCEADRRAVVEAIGDGTIDVISSGHDPVGPEEKRLPFEGAQVGMVGAETLFSCAAGLVRDGVIGWPRAFDLLAANPATLMGLETGALDAGLPADIALFDPRVPWVVGSDGSLVGAQNSPFVGRPMEGRALALFKGGLRLV